MAKNKIAVFDIDGTIFRSSWLIELDLKLIEQGIFPVRALKDVDKSYHNWLDRKGSYEDYLRGMVDIYKKNIRGHKEKDVRRIIRQIMQRQKERVYIYTRDLLNKLHKDYFLLAISGLPLEVIEDFARFWGFDLFYGQVYEVRNGRYTGEILKSPYDNKKEALFACLSQINIGLKGSIGVGDTESDISFLEEVDHPICFNPNQKLLKVACRRGWKVVVERKDVVHVL